MKFEVYFLHRLALKCIVNIPTPLFDPPSIIGVYLVFIYH